MKSIKDLYECCNQEDPFKKSSGEPYLEVRHIKRLSDGRPDIPERVAAICHNCHSEAHHGENRKVVKEILLKHISKRERSLVQR